MITTDAFRLRFPEFSRLSEEMLLAYVSAAEAELSADVWGSLHGEGVLYLAASNLALTAFGQQAKLSNGSGHSTYLRRYKDLELFIGCGVARVCR